jgi:hypothetical protein
VPYVTRLALIRHSCSIDRIFFSCLPSRVREPVLSRASCLPPHPHLIQFPTSPATHVPARPPRLPSPVPRCTLPGLSSSNRPPTDLLTPTHSCCPLPCEEVDEHHQPAWWGWRYRSTDCSSSQPSHDARSIGAPYNEDLAPPHTPYPYSASGRADSALIPLPPL